MSGPAWAGAWTLPKGEGQVIVKYEPVSATERFNEKGKRVDLLHRREDQVVSLWGEYGLNDKLTLMLKTDWQDADDGFHAYEGMGPTEVGARLRLLERSNWVVSVQASYSSDTEGRNAAWGSPGEGEAESDLRLLVGKGFDGSLKGYYEVQLARRWRDDLSDETRVEASFGVVFKEKYTALAQVYAGQTDLESAKGGARWGTLELGVVRDWQNWSLQTGWRTTLTGRNVPVGEGPVVALWRRF